MCLVAVAVRAHDRYPLIVAGNRDEMHARASAAAEWWYDQPQLFGGRDLVAGGSWLAVNRSGEIAVVLNIPGRALLPGERLSRGALVSEFLNGDEPAEKFLRELDREAERYAGFSLIIGSMDEIRMTASPAPESFHNRRLERGIHVFSNTPPEQSWPKDGYLREQFAALLAESDITPESILRLLERREPVTGLADDDERLPAQATTPFVVGPEYGTRASTVVMFDRDGNCRFVEHRFGANAEPAGQSVTTFRAVT